jgi:hypothetical protein
LWHIFLAELPKLHRHTLGAKIDNALIETLESVSAAVFLSGKEKLPYVRYALRKVDATKLLLMVLWETKSLDTKKYIELSEALDDVGKMLGGWHGQLSKLNPAKERGEK